LTSLGHQLHFDSDNEGCGGVRNPIVSTVICVEGGVGGPTLVTTQKISDNKLAKNGWLVFPEENRFVMFDGSVLHGVIPGQSFVSEPQKRRITFMIAFWKEIVAHPDPNEIPGASRPFPNLEKTRYTWPKLLPKNLVGFGDSHPKKN